MTQATVGESCKGLQNALTNAIARRLPLGIARPLRIVRVRTYQMRTLAYGHARRPRRPGTKVIFVVPERDPFVTLRMATWRQVVGVPELSRLSFARAARRHR